MNTLSFRSLLLLLGLLALTTLACGLFSDPGAPPRNAVVVEVGANSSLEPWLTTAVAEFNASETQTAGGKPVFVQLTTVESGQAVADYAAGAPAPALWIPEDQVWVNILADQGVAGFQGDCASVATSPLVIGMWRDAAESLGYPGLQLGWLDIASLAADPSAWAYYSGGAFGDTLRLSHTHPGLSGSGASTLLAIVQAAEGQTEAVTTAEIQQPIVQASVGAFESAVTSFNTSTDNLGRTMSDRGPQYLGAAVMYESTVVEHGNGRLVAIYPLEGTFVATHPACVNAALDGETAAAAAIFRDYLTGEAGQQGALARGLRPVNPAVAPGMPLTPENGVDPDQPTAVFNPPSVETVYAVQELWQTARKPVNLVMLVDTSGSMRGEKIENMQAAAIQFVQQMGDDDTISLVEFHSFVDVKTQQARVRDERDTVAGMIAEMVAGGDTTLYDAVGRAGDIVAETTAPDASNVIIVLTDGQDTASTQWNFNDALIAHATANDAAVYTIAYGRDADQDILAELATRGNGNFYLGDEASIAAIYEEMSAAFGGSVGVGR